MRRPEGIQLGPYSILGGLDPSSLFDESQLAQLRRRVPGVFDTPRRRIETVRADARAHVAIEAHEEAHIEPAIEPAIRTTTVSRHLPILDPVTRKRVCLTCPSPCCTILAAGLTEEEARSGRYRVEGPDQHGNHYLARPYGRCAYLTQDNSCSIYQDRPAVCRNYQCDGDPPDHRIDRWLMRAA